MATLQFQEQENHPEGSFVARIVDIQEDKQAYGLVFRIGLVTEEGAIEAMCSQSYTTKSKFTSLVRAAFGQIPENIDTDTLIGKSVGIVVEPYEKGEVTYSRVSSFHRLKQKKASKDDPFEDA